MDIVEEWKTVAGFEDYEVSNLGNVRNRSTMRVLKAATNKYYRVVSLRNDGTSFNKQVHRLVAIAFIPNPDKKPCVDHIAGLTGGDGVNNLRWATKAENSMNCKKRKNNTSGFKGVCFNKLRNKYLAQISINGKRTHLGYFNTAEEARAAYRGAAAVYHGDFARYE